MNEDGPLCPHCRRPAIWDFQDTATIDGRHYVERALVCADGCDWTGSIALFKTRGASDHDRARGIGPTLPADPFDDAVPMLAPGSLNDRLLGHGPPLPAHPGDGAVPMVEHGQQMQRIAKICAMMAVESFRKELLAALRESGYRANADVADILDPG